MAPERYIQLASGPDTALIQRADIHELGWIIAAQYALRGRQSLSTRVDVVDRLLVDPQTARLDASLRWAIAQDGKEKLTYRRLWDEYLKGVSPEAAQRLRETGLVTATEDERRQIIDNVLGFQTRCLDMNRAFDEELFEVAELPAAQRRVSPDALFGAYLLVRDLTSLERQADLYRLTPQRWEDLSVDRVLALHPRAFESERLMARIRSIEWGAARVWIAVPGFRDGVLPRRLGPTALRLRSLIRFLASRGPVGLLGASFPLCTLISDGISAVAFGPHLETGRVRASSGGPLAQSYVADVHGWAPYDEVGQQLRRHPGRSDVAEIFCADENCLELLDAVGIDDFCSRMFSTVGTRRGCFAAPDSRRLQDVHAIRSRMLEIDEISSVSRLELARVLAASARRSPFPRPAAFLARWAAILRIDELAAA